jgi:hypothetical protein
VNNLQLNSTGLFQTPAESTGSRLFTMYKVTDSTLANSGTIAALSTTNTQAAIFVAGDSNNLTINNAGTISTAGSGQAILIGNNGVVPVSTTIDGTHVFTINPSATNITLNNSGVLTSQGVALGIGGTSSAVTLNNTGTIVTAAAGGASAISVQDAASHVNIVNSGTIMSAGGSVGMTPSSPAGPAISITTAGSGIAITNAGRISGTGGTGLAIDHSAGTTSLAISNSGTINGGIVLSQPGDTVSITGGAINGTISTVSAGVTSTGGGIAISNAGTISGSGGTGLAIDHSAGTTSLAISNSGTINGGIVLSQPGDTVSITGGAINGAISTVNAGTGTVTFNAPRGFTTGSDFGSAATPLGAITVAGGTLNLGNALIANTVTFGAGSITRFTSTVNAVANNGVLNFAGGALTLGTNALVLGANASVKTSTADGSTINVTISPIRNGLINARAGNATVDTRANTLVIRPNLTIGVVPKPGSKYVVIATSSGANVGNALSKLSVAPGPSAAPFSVGTATSTTDAFGNPLTPGKDIVLITSGESGTTSPTQPTTPQVPIVNAGAAANAAVAPSNMQIERVQVNAIVSAVTGRIGNAVSGAVAGQILTPTRTGGLSGGDESGVNWTIWQDTSGHVLHDTATGSSYHGTIWTGLAGVDRPIGDNIIVGAVLGGEGESFDLTSSGGQRSGTGISFTPYAAYIINDWASVDFEASYALLDNNVKVVEGQPHNNHYVDNRVFVAGNVAAYWNVDAFTLRGKFGLLWANTSGPIYGDANGVRTKPPNTTLEEAMLGGEITYHHDRFEPFVNLTAQQDLSKRRGGGTGDAD